MTSPVNYHLEGASSLYNCHHSSITGMFEHSCTSSLVFLWGGGAAYLSTYLGTYVPKVPYNLIYFQCYVCT